MPQRKSKTISQDQDRKNEVIAAVDSITPGQFKTLLSYAVEEVSRLDEELIEVTGDRDAYKELYEQLISNTTPEETTVTQLKTIVKSNSNPEYWENRAKKIDAVKKRRLELISKRTTKST